MPCLDSQKPVSLTEPRPYQVVQRHGFEPRLAHANNPGGPCLGIGTVRIAGHAEGMDTGALEARALLLSGANGQGTGWQPLGTHLQGGAFSTRLEVPAGGWYRLEIRSIASGTGLGLASVEPVGVGEVFIIAGQSYASNANAAQTFIEDPQGRVTIYDWMLSGWQVAHDPQPILGQPPIHSDTQKGSIWPSAMNALLPLIRVPIGMINVAVGGTGSLQWMPGDTLHERMVQAGLVAGDFRFMLWQQGESDVQATPPDLYKARIASIKRALESRLGFSRPWVLAKSTLHPPAYDDPEREGWIRQAIDDLWQLGGFLPGPDTDILGGIGIHRDGMEGSKHFSALGQERAGLLWFAALWNHLNHAPGDRDSAEHVSKVMRGERP